MYYSGQIIKGSINRFPVMFHYGIILVENEVVKVLHNTPFRGSVIDTLDKWLNTRTQVSIEDTTLVSKSNTFIIDHFKDLCQKDYILHQYNCEHFISCMLSQKLESEQLRTWSIGLSFLALIYLAKVKK